MMRASSVSPAAALTRYSKPPAPLIVPANTASPAAFSTGRLSPVIGAWSMLVCPLSTWPSSAMRSPGRTRTSAPGATLLAATSCQSPAGCSTVACSGASRIRPWIASRARSSERASMRSASVNSTITIAASGHWPSSNAPVTAMLISALMLRLPLRSAVNPLR